MNSVVTLEKACPNCEYTGFAFYSNHCKSMYMCHKCGQIIFEKNTADKYKCPCEVNASWCLGLPGFKIIHKVIRETPSLKIIRRFNEHR